MPIPLKLELAIEGVSPRYSDNPKRKLRELIGVKLSGSEARAVWPRILEHKWFVSERLGRDVGLRVAAIDYWESFQPRQAGRTTERRVIDWLSRAVSRISALLVPRGEVSETSLAAFERAMRGTRSLAR